MITVHQKQFMKMKRLQLQQVMKNQCIRIINFLGRNMNNKYTILGVTNGSITYNN